MSLNNTGNIKVYACGGCGINVGSHFETFRGKQEDGYATIDVTYIDTSKSNMTSDVMRDNAYIYEGVDGSGKIRGENNEQIAECIPEILQQYKPQDLSIVISSASGGSGSIIAASLVSELLSRGKPVIAFMVASTDSRIELNNSIKSLKTYEKISTSRKIPVPVMFFSNSKETPRAVVDEKIQMSIVMLSALFSRQNKELDSSDLANWLNYTKVTDHKPHMVMLEFFSNTITVQRPAFVITVATLSSLGSETSPGAMVEYQCVGYMNTESLRKMKTIHPIHAVLIDGAFNSIYEDLNKTFSDAQEAHSSRVVRNSILTDSENNGNKDIFI